MSNVGALTTTQTWEALSAELRDELRKWRKEDFHLPYKGESKSTGVVKLTMLFNGVEKTISCDRFPTPTQNLCAINQVIRSTRLAEQRGIGGLLAEVSNMVALPEFDAYRILAVGPTDTPGAIQAAYRDKVQMYHPDKPTGNRLMFDMVQRAGKELGVA